MKTKEYYFDQLTNANEDVSYLEEEYQEYLREKERDDIAEAAMMFSWLYKGDE